MLRAAVAVGVVICGAAQAQRYEVSALAGMLRLGGAPLGSLYETGGKDDDSRLRGRSGYGVRLTLNTRGYFGHEVGYIYSRATFQTKLRTTDGKTTTVTSAEAKVIVRQVFYDFLMYSMPAGERFRPFIAAGAQAHQYGAPAFADYDIGRSRNYGVNYGGGLKIRLFPHALLRFDVRHSIGGKPYNLTYEDVTKTGGMLRQLEASFGVGISF
jgi:hypothetical protein